MFFAKIGRLGSLLKSLFISTGSCGSCFNLRKACLVGINYRWAKQLTVADLDHLNPFWKYTILEFCLLFFRLFFPSFLFCEKASFHQWWCCSHLFRTRLRDRGTRSELRGCINDVNNMQKVSQFCFFWAWTNSGKMVQSRFHLGCSLWNDLWCPPNFFSNSWWKG